MQTYTCQVAIIGGGATGVGILWDLSLRGIPALLLEQGDLAHGTSSRFHGLLHSGGRYAVNDPVSAAECAQENAVLKHIAPACIADTGGWFVQMEDDDPKYAEAWLKGCAKARIPVREIALEEALAKEPLLSRRAKRVFEVPDAAVDGFKLVWANAKKAKELGGNYLTYHRVDEIHLHGKRITGVGGVNLITGEPFVAQADIVVNAAGAWADIIAARAGAVLEVVRDKGTLLAFNQRLFGRVINRLRIPGDGDIFVPHETITIFGTTSAQVDSPQANEPLTGEVARLLALGEEMLPNIESYRIIRAFSGVRPLHREDQEADICAGSSVRGETREQGRKVSRAFAIVDHGAEDGVQGFLSLVGGKFTTYRMMAEKACDLITAKLGLNIPCRTREEIIAPQPDESLVHRAEKLLPAGIGLKMVERLGESAEEVLADIEREPQKGQLLCECERVTRAEVEHVLADKDTHHLGDVRRKTRLGMGTCQGAFCTYRVLPLLFGRDADSSVRAELKTFLEQRWKGIRPVLWGQQMRETEFTRAIYLGLLAVKQESDNGDGS